MKKLLVLWGLLMTLSGAQAQTATTDNVLTSTAVPYTEKEFDPFLLKLRRAEIIAIGAFPLVYLFSGLGYDYYYYASQNFSQDYIPWPAGAGTSRWTTSSQPEALQRKNLTLVGISLATGVLLAAIDWWLGE